LHCLFYQLWLLVYLYQFVRRREKFIGIKECDNMKSNMRMVKEYSK
jgi:hypothetical protein